MEGPYAEDARRIVDMEYLFFMGPAQDIEQDEAKQSLLKIADLLRIPDGTEHYRLRLLQEYIAVTEPQQ